MIPLRDTISSKTRPYVNDLIIGVCVLVFLYERSLGPGVEDFVSRFGVVPSEVAAVLTGTHFSITTMFPLVSSMFLHAGWLHLIGNMLFLFVFGDNVEDRLGHGGYVAFYLLGGIGASLVEVYFTHSSEAPLIGASGAIAAVMGAYFILYPRARVLTVIPLFFFFPVVELPAFFFLGFWFVLQFIQGGLSLGAEEAGGVAWWAHAGGFLVGIILLPVFLLLRKLS